MMTTNINIIIFIIIITMIAAIVIVIVIVIVRYLENQWISGPHPPYTWNCFGRVEDATNNAQEAFNGVLNRLIKVKNPRCNLGWKLKFCFLKTYL